MTDSGPSDAARIANLSGAEVDCLRLVSAGVTSSKAIALQTGLSPGTIDTYLSRSAKTLGVKTRHEAAARFLQLFAAPPLPKTSQYASQSRPERLSSSPQSRFTALAAGARWLFTVPPISGPEHSLTWTEKTLAIVRNAAVSLSAVVILTMVGAGLLWVTG